VRRPDPAGSQSHRTIVDLRNAELLKAFDPGHDVHHGIHGSDLVQLNLSSGESVNPPLSLPQEGKGLDGTLSYPGRKLGVLDHRDQVSDPTVTLLMMIGFIVAVSVRMVPMIRGVAVVGFDRMRGVLLETSGEQHIDLRCRDTAAIYPLYLNPDFGEPQASRNPAEPVRRDPGRHQGSEEHVAADAGSRVQNCKASVRHRLTICLLGQPQANR
jgi:hypothetical protein